MEKGLPMEFIKELTLMTIQKEVRWMEYDNEMEDFQLQEYLDESLVSDLSLFLCGYLPEMDMELAVQVFEKSRKGILFTMIRGGGSCRQQEFSMEEFSADFELNMLVYAANTQILQREMEENFRLMARRMAEAEKGCAGCSGCR